LKKKMKFKKKKNWGIWGWLATLFGGEVEKQLYGVLGEGSQENHGASYDMLVPPISSKWVWLGSHGSL
jgi:hypothetical protein